MKSGLPWFYPLTPRQAQVSELVAAGLSNEEIAKAIFINRTTLDYQVHQVFSKLDFHRRSEIVDWVTRNGPTPYPLSTRQFQLAALIAAGLTYGEIAKRFVNTERTIQARVHMILVKLDVPRRAQIVEWVRNRPRAQPLAV